MKSTSLDEPPDPGRTAPEPRATTSSAPPRRRRRRLVLLALALAPVLYLAYVVAGLPSRASVRALTRGRPEETSVMRQRDDEARRAGRKPRRVMRYVPLSAVSRHLIHAVVAAEDPNFFGHQGVDWEAVRESVELNVKRGRFARGGSTITQQLAKNLCFTTYKSLTRKLRELLVARWLEEDLSKGRILELYLNLIEWGDGIYGCEAAAHYYYGKPAAALDEVEAAGLAAMIPGPRSINPRANPARHARAQRRVLRLMARLGFVRQQVGTFGQTPPTAPLEEEAEGPPPEEGPAPAPPEESAAAAEGGTELPLPAEDDAPE